ncbi:MAG: hypothetical protein JW881_06845 [Spirochaetales bacterium]|nr:hypothetical protein [Spirochaetales bacterium]
MLSNKSQITYFLVLLLLVLPSLLNASIEMSLHLKIVDMKNAGPPEFFGDNIIFTYKNTHPIRFVGAIFEHESYATPHVYQRNQHNVFFLIYRKPADRVKLTYRLIIDGLIVPDPQNPHIERDISGVEYSVVEIRTLPDIPVQNPQKTGTGEYVFILKTRPESHVSLVGDFNDWDPFMHILTESPAGFFRISLRIAPGRHYYYFFVDGEKRLDSSNMSRMVNSIGEEVCTFHVP